MGGSLSSLSDKEAQLMSHLSDSREVLSQRILAQKVGVSVGLLNAVMGKLIRRGYVKAKALNKKKIKYLLTSKGSARITRRIYRSLIGTIRQYQELETRINSLLAEAVLPKHKKVSIHGSGDLAVTIRRVLRTNFKGKINLAGYPDGDPDILILNVTASQISNRQKVVNVFEYLKSERNQTLGNGHFTT